MLACSPMTSSRICNARRTAFDVAQCDWPVRARPSLGRRPATNTGLRSAFILYTATTPARREVSSLFFRNRKFLVEIEYTNRFSPFADFAVSFDLYRSMFVFSSFPYFSDFGCPCLRPSCLAVSFLTQVSVSSHLVTFGSMQGCEEDNLKR